MPTNESERLRANVCPTVGDRVRLADTDLVIQVKRILRLRRRSEVWRRKSHSRWNGTIPADAYRRCGRHSHHQRTHSRPLGNCEGDIAIKDGRIAAIGKSGNPDVQPGVDIIIGRNEVIAGEGNIVTAGGIDTHVHFICPQQIEEALFSGVTTMMGGGTGRRRAQRPRRAHRAPAHTKDARSRGFLPVNLGFSGKATQVRPPAWLNR